MRARQRAADDACHNKAATAGLKTQASADDTACESAALAKYNTAVGKLTGCPPCLAGALPSLAGGSRLASMPRAARPTARRRAARSST